MLEIKTQNELKTLAEAADIATWPVETSGRSFKPGVFYSLGALSAPLSYSFTGGAESSQWGFSFTTGDSEIAITHPSDAAYTDFTKAPAHSRIEIFAIQDGGKKYITQVVYPIERTSHVVDGVIQDSWEEFFRIVDQGRAASVYAVGNQIPIVLNGRVQLMLEIAGFGTDELAQGTENCKVAFLAKTLVAAPLSFFVDKFTGAITGSTNTAGFANWGHAEKGYLRNFLEEFLLPAFPENVRRRVVTVKKTHPVFESSTATAAQTQTSLDQVFVPSKAELDTGGKYAELGVSNANRIRSTADGTAQIYHLRSAATATTNDIVMATGAFSTVSIHEARYIRFGFCI